jgi:uncharacterized iron-regulated membrane protein
MALIISRVNAAEYLDDHIRKIMRGLLLKTHLYLGLVAALFLIVLGLTGSVIAFESDIPHWLHRDLFYVETKPRALPESALVMAAEQRFPKRKVLSVQFLRHPDLVRVMQMTGGVRVMINPYDGKIKGMLAGRMRSEQYLGYIHQIHLRLVPDPRSMPSLAEAGKTIVSVAGLFLCLLVPSGLILFWKTRRTTVKWSASWFRICFDLHHVIGVYASVFLFVAALTGIMIGFDFGENAFFTLTNSKRPGPPPEVHSTPDAMANGSWDIDRAVSAALVALPGSEIAGYVLPKTPTDVFTILLRVPEETSDSVYSRVALDRYSGKVLLVRDFRVDSPGYSWVRFNRSIHTGDVKGTPTHILMSLSSLLLVAMVFTGVVIWWRKLAV